MTKSQLSRRNFLGRAAAVGAVGAIGGPALITSCAPKGKGKDVEYLLSHALDKAPDGPELKAGLVGCGGRGTGAAMNFLDAGPNLKITAIADVLQDKIDKCRADLKEQRNIEIPDENVFLGFDAYEKLLQTNIDVVILATPPFFRPMQFEAAVQARKHVFMEKPVAVDPAGARSIMATSRKADAMELSVITGTQRRHQRDYIEIYKKVAGGTIGEVVGGNVYWNQSKLWHVNPKAEWSEMEAMLRNWVNWTWLSGDHIVEQHVHNIDVGLWFFGKNPERALGFGSRQRRVTGDQYDSFSVDFVFDDGRHLHSMCRQINGCGGGVFERIQGAAGSANLNWNNARLLDLNGNELYSYPYVTDAQGNKSLPVGPYNQEHIDLVTAIRTGKPINEAYNCAASTMAGIMGRISAFTGKEVTWEEVMNSDLMLGPKVFVMGPVDVPKEVPVPGEAYIG
ncbi:MAG: Gfo/Idh/MocA family oxidoreductase [Bacteroidales bacterium]